MTILARLNSLPAAWLTMGVVVLTVALATVDYATGTDFDFLIFYLLPLFVVAWRWGGWTAYACVVIGVLLHVEADRLSSPVYTVPAFFYVDIVEDLAILSLFVFGLMRLKTTLRQLQEANERELRINQELQKALRLKTEFLNIAAHDLKNPLTGILGFSDLLTKPGATQTSADVVEMAQFINSAARRMLYLIKNLLDASKYENRQFQPAPAELDLAVITLRLTAQNGVRATEKNIVVHNEIEGAVPAWADPMLIEQVMDNLLSNAIKFSPPGRSIFVRGQVEGDQVLWKVQDQGPGLSAADKAKLFQKFTRLSARPTGGENSTGLGLSIVKLLVEAMHGRVWCESEQGQGATFIVALPRTKPEERR